MDNSQATEINRVVALEPFIIEEIVLASASHGPDAKQRRADAYASLPEQMSLAEISYLGRRVVEGTADLNQKHIGRESVPPISNKVSALVWIGKLAHEREHLTTLDSAIAALRKEEGLRPKWVVFSLSRAKNTHLKIPSQKS